jgi:hypothetical protein
MEILVILAIRPYMAMWPESRLLRPFGLDLPYSGRYNPRTFRQAVSFARRNGSTGPPKVLEVQRFLAAFKFRSTRLDV